MKDYTVLIKTSSDGYFIYHLSAPTAAQAGMYANKVWVAHSHVEGGVEFIFEGTIVPLLEDGPTFNRDTRIISLQPTWGDAA